MDERCLFEHQMDPLCVECLAEKNFHDLPNHFTKNIKQSLLDLNDEFNLKNKWKSTELGNFLASSNILNEQISLSHLRDDDIEDNLIKLQNDALCLADRFQNISKQLSESLENYKRTREMIRNCEGNKMI